MNKRFFAHNGYLSNLETGAFYKDLNGQARTFSDRNDVVCFVEQELDGHVDEIEWE